MTKMASAEKYHLVNPRRLLALPFIYGQIYFMAFLDTESNEAEMYIETPLLSILFYPIW